MGTVARAAYLGSFRSPERATVGVTLNAIRELAPRSASGLYRLAYTGAHPRASCIPTYGIPASEPPFVHPLPQRGLRLGRWRL